MPLALIATVPWPLGVRVAIGLAGFAIGAILWVVVTIVEFGAWTLVVPPRGDRRRRPDGESGLGAPDAALVPEPIEARATDGVRLAGRWYPAPGERPAARTILLLHGFAEDPSAWEAGRASILNRHGWNVAALDSRGYGRRFIDLQRENDAYYFVANYHALTSVRDAEQLRAYTFDVIVTMLSLGLDPDRATLFVQSDVPETAELAWLLTTVTPMGWLEKCVSYKDKIQQGLPAEHGLFAYPVLQAADILLYDADLVPVGQDQKQHLEITRDVAERFNHVYGGGEEVFRLPKPYILDSVSVVPGLDGRKMSKSYNNTIDIFDEPAAIRKKVKRIVTDSTPVEAPKNPETDPLFNLFKLFAAGDELAEVERRYREGGHRLRRGQVPARRGHDRPVRARPRAAGRMAGASRTRRRGPRRGRRARPGHGPRRPRPRPPGLRRGVRRRDDLGRSNERSSQEIRHVHRRHRRIDPRRPAQSPAGSLEPGARVPPRPGAEGRPAVRGGRTRGAGRPRNCSPCPPPSGMRSSRQRLPWRNPTIAMTPNSSPRQRFR